MRQDKLESTKTEIQGNTGSCHKFEGCWLFKGKPNKTMHYFLEVHSASRTNGATEALVTN